MDRWPVAHACCLTEIVQQRSFAECKPHHLRGVSPLQAGRIMQAWQIQRLQTYVPDVPDTHTRHLMDISEPFEHVSFPV